MLDAAPAREAAPSRRRAGPGGWRRAVSAVGAPAIAYFVLACVLFWPVAPFDGSHIVGCACGDAVQQAWFLDWVPYALSHGHNPLFSSYLNAPHGVNLGVNTSMPLLGFLGWPVTAADNSVAAYNVLLRLSLALSALSMYLVLRRYVRSPAAAALGGLLFGFSPYMLAQAQLHVFLVFLPFLPPLIPLVDRWLVRADRNPYRCGALVGLLLGLQMLISAEMVVVVVLFAVIAVLPVAVRHHGLVRSRLPLLARGLVAALLVAVPVGGIVPWMYLAGAQRPTTPPHSVANLDGFHADLLSLVVPSRPQLLRPPLLHHVADQFVQGSTHENGFYLGLPLLVVVIACAVLLRRNLLVSSLATLGAVSFVLGLGTHLTVANHATGLPLPFAAIAHLPLLQEIGPTRFALAIQLAAAVLLAVGLDHALVLARADRRRSAGSRVRGPAALVALSALLLVPLLPAGFVHSVPTRVPGYFAAGARDIPAGATVLTYPYPYYSSNAAMLWQSAADMRFRMPGGEIYVPSASGSSVNYPHEDLPPALWAVLVHGGPHRLTDAQWRAPSAAQRLQLVRELRGYVAAFSIDAVIEGTGGAQGRWIAGLTATAFGPPSTTHGDVAVWQRPG